MEGTRRYSFQPPKHAGRAAHAVHFLSALYSRSGTGAERPDANDVHVVAHRLSAARTFAALPVHQLAAHGGDSFGCRHARPLRLYCENPFLNKSSLPSVVIQAAPAPAEPLDPDQRVCRRPEPFGAVPQQLGEEVRRMMRIRVGAIRSCMKWPRSIRPSWPSGFSPENATRAFPRARPRLSGRNPGGRVRPGSRRSPRRTTGSAGTLRQGWLLERPCHRPAWTVAKPAARLVEPPAGGRMPAHRADQSPEHHAASWWPAATKASTYAIMQALHIGDGSSPSPGVLVSRC